MSRALGVGGLTEVLPLPGVGEMRDIMKGVISVVKTVGYEKDQCESLARRFDGLIAVADTVKDLAEFAQILSQLQAMKTGFEKKIGYKSRLSRALCAQDRLQAYECLSREVTDLMESFQFHLLASISRRGIEEKPLANKKWIEDNFKTIDTHKLYYEDGPLTQLTRPGVSSVPTTAIDCHPSPVHVTQHFGRLGKLRVVCTSYFSHSDHTAKVETAEEELKQLSRVRHKNIAAIVGVTKGCDGLDGHVVAMEGIPVRIFLAGSVSGSALGRYLQNLHEAHEFLSCSRIPLKIDDDVDSVTVTPDGRVTALPSPGDPWYRPDFKKWATSTTISNALGLYNEEFHRSENYDPGKRTSRVVEALMSLGQSHLTELRLLKVLADYVIEPFSSVNFWSSSTSPPFMVRAGDIGCVKDLEMGNSEWQVLEASSDTEEMEYPDIPFSQLTGGRKYRWRRTHSIHPQYRTWMIDYHYVPLQNILTHSSSSRSICRWEDVMKQANVLSKHHKIELDKISHVCSATVIAYIIIPYMSKQLAPGTSLYFHRHDFARSSPHEFYGFFSASLDPCAPRTGLEDLNWRFEYKVEYHTTRINDDWGKQYRQAVQAGLAGMPGGYPGACIEEVSDDEED